MKTAIRIIALVFLPSLFAGGVFAQIDDICRELGAMPSLEAPKLTAPFVYGKINIVGSVAGSKTPRVTISFTDRGQPSVRQTLDKSGNYCFRRTGGDGFLVVEVDGNEFARRNIAGFGPEQQREDFEVHLKPSTQPVSSAVVSSKFIHPRGAKAAALIAKADESEKKMDLKKAAEFTREALELDPLDFIAWAKLGSLLLGLGKTTEAESAFKRSLELKLEYTPAWIQMGSIRADQKLYDLAIEIFKQAISTDPSSAIAYRSLGEAYLQAKMGTLGAEALNKAIELDPLGMAECHLLLARLYRLAGAPQLAVREYRLFLEKIPGHPERAQFEKFINENSK